MDHRTPGRTKTLVLALLILAWLLPLPTALAAGKRSRPEIVIPKFTKTPVVDGVFSKGEWDRAALITGFIGAGGPMGGKMVPINSKIYLGHDGKRFYMAVYCQLPPGGKPTMNYRRRDEPVYMDRYQLELWLAPPVRDKLVAYQMIGNAYGAIFDNRQIPALGAVTSGWNGNWDFKNSYKTGEYWTAELSIPFTDFGEKKVKPDEFWGGMVGVAWPQRSWPYTYGWYKNVDTHAKMYMSERGSCVRADDLSCLFDNTLAPTFTLVNGEKRAGEFTVEFQVGAVKYQKKVKVGKGRTKKVTFARELPPFPKNIQSKVCRVRITGPRGKTLLAGDWLFRPMPAKDRKLAPVKPKPWAMATRVLFAPLALGIKAWADVLDYPRRNVLATARFTVRPKGGTKAIVSRTITNFDYDAAESYLWLPKNLPYGEYEVVTAFLNRAGKILDRKIDPIRHRDLKKEFVWLNTDYGEKLTVAPPFTAIRARGKTMKVWGREFQMRGALPAQVVSQGAAMLARPINFVAEIGGKKVEAKVARPFKLTKTGRARSEFSGEYTLAGLRLKLKGYLDFDGVMYYSLKAVPLRGKTGANVTRLYLSMPVKAANARYYHSTGGGWSPALGFVPKTRNGMFWDSRDVADFVPYVGLSDDDRAIQWFADNDHDWVLGKDFPCAQLVRSRNVVEAQINLVRKKGPVPGFAAKFGLVATPVKPMPSGWRHTSLHFGTVADSKLTFFYGPGHGGCPIDPHDTAKLCKALNINTAGKNPDAVLRDLPAGAAPFEKEHLTKVMGAKFVREFMPSLRRDSHRKTCYFFNASMYFEGYRSKGFATFFPGEWQLDPRSGWFHLTPTESYQDFFSFHMDLWFKHWVINGLYFDECYLHPDYNVFNGNGKIMPDGTVRPSVPLMKQRRFMNRMRQLFINHQREPFIWVHTSNYMAPYAISAADIAMFGEDRIPTPGVDIMDTIPAALMRTIGRSQKFGFVPVWMVQAGRGGDGDRHVGRQSYGWCWMHDTVPEYHTSRRGRPLLALRKGWGIDQDDVKFIPYWNNARYLKTNDPKFIVSAWTRPRGKLHLLVMNLHYENERKTNVTVTLDTKALGLKSGVTAYDLETGPAIGQFEKQMREADRLRRLDPVANAGKISTLARDARSYIQKVRYDKSLWQKVGNGPKFRLAVPARDFKVLIVE